MTKGILFTDFKPFEGQFGRGSKKLGWLLGRDKNRSVIRRILLRRFYYSETRESADGKCHKVKYVASASQLVFFFFFFFRAHSVHISDCYRSLYIHIRVHRVSPKVSEHFSKTGDSSDVFPFRSFRYGLLVNELLQSRNPSDICRRKYVMDISSMKKLYRIVSLIVSFDNTSIVFWRLATVFCC